MEIMLILCSKNIFAIFQNNEKTDSTTLIIVVVVILSVIGTSLVVIVFLKVLKFFKHQRGVNVTNNLPPPSYLDTVQRTTYDAHNLNGK